MKCVTAETFTGVFVVDKPAGWTSHDVVNKVRRMAQTRKVGHLGTLDPMATGVLPLLIGRATRLAQFFERGRKVYEGTVRFGYATDTYDAEGTALCAETSVSLNCAEIEGHLESFRGRILQTPPPVSAKKIGGSPAYKLARKNIPVTLAPVEVEIFSIDVLRCEGNEIDMRVVCAAGTYMRSIAHDLGQRLGCGAFLGRLRRIESGSFTIEQSHRLEDLQRLSENHRLGEALVPAAQLLPDFPAERVDSVTAGFIRQGRDFRVSPFRGLGGAQFIKAVTQDGDLIAIGEAKLPHLYHPILVL
jgi:tRNA pseudouridine55 synthase